MCGLKDSLSYILTFPMPMVDPICLLLKTTTYYHMLQGNAMMWEISQPTGGLLSTPESEENVCTVHTKAFSEMLCSEMFEATSI